MIRGAAPDRATGRPRRQRGQRGSQALEFALLLPAFLLGLVGIMEVAWLFYLDGVLGIAAVRGCRAAALVDGGEGDSNFAQVLARAREVTRADLDATLGAGTAAAGSLSVEVSTFGERPARSLLCTARLQVQPLPGLVLDPLVLDQPVPVRMEWQREP